MTAKDKLYQGGVLFDWIVKWFTDHYHVNPHITVVYIVETDWSSPSKSSALSLTVGSEWLEIMAAGDPELKRLLVMEEL